MKKIIFICLLIAGMNGLLFSLPADKMVKFEHISSEHGLAQNTVRCILQDSKGFMWFGTRDGLARYDGYTFTTYKQEPNNADSLSNNEINALCEDDSGMLWIGTSGGGLTRFDMKKERFFRYKIDPKKITHKTITALCHDREGALWVGTLGGGLIQLIREPGKTERFVHYRKSPGEPNNLGSDFVSSIYEDRAGVLWFGLYHEGLKKFNRDKGTFSGLRKNDGDADSLSRDMVNKIYEDRAGKLWTGTYRGGIYVLNRKTGTFHQYKMNPNDPTDPNGLTSNFVTDIREDRSGTLWVGTTDGLNRFDVQTGTFTHYRKSSGKANTLSHNHILCLYGDWSDVLWIGTTREGLNKLHREIKFKHYTAPDDPEEPDDYSVFAILEDRSGMLWIGTGTRGLYKFDRKTGAYTHYTHQKGNLEGLSHNNIRALHEDQSGKIWIGAYGGGGINVLNKETGKFHHYKANPAVPGCLSNNTILRFYQTLDGVLWIGTFRGGLNKFNRDTKTFTHYKKIEDNPKSLSGNIVTAIYEAPSEPGVLWIGTGYSGLTRFDTNMNTFRRFQAEPDDPHSLGYNTVLSILEDRSGVLWVTTYGGGLNKVIRESSENISFVHYTEKDGLCNNSIYGILEDSNGNLWLSTNKGLSKFDPKTGIFRNYTVSDGLQGYEYNSGAYFKNKSGEMFFGGLNGLNVFHPSKVKDNPHIPPIVISGFTLLNQPVPIGRDSPLQNSITHAESLKLSHKQNVFSFEFSAMDSTIPEKNNYAYMIEGYHSQWIDLGNKREINVIGLTPGEYILRVRGTNNDGVWNEEGTSLKIIISPPFWQTWWFRALCVLILLIILVVWHRSRMESLSLRLKTETELNRIYENYNISKREKDILQLILKGKTNKDIEDELYISVKTVKNHVYNIYQKLGVKTRLELIHRIQKSARLN